MNLTFFKLSQSLFYVDIFQSLQNSCTGQDGELQKAQAGDKSVVLEGAGNMWPFAAFHTIVLLVSNPPVNSRVLVGNNSLHAVDLPFDPSNKSPQHTLHTQLQFGRPRIPLCPCPLCPGPWSLDNK